MKKSRWLVPAAFLGGIVLANFLEKELYTSYGILNAFYLQRYAMSEIDGDGIFFDVLWERMKAAAAVLVCSRLLQAQAAILFECLASGSFGALLVIAFANLGVKGFAVVLAGLFPQWIFYLLAFACYAKMLSGTRYPVGESSRPLLLFFSVALFLAGIAAEGYLNPFVLQQVVRLIAPYEAAFP